MEMSCASRESAKSGREQGLEATKGRQNESRPNRVEADRPRVQKTHSALLEDLSAFGNFEDHHRRVVVSHEVVVVKGTTSVPFHFVVTLSSVDALQKDS